MNVLRRWFGALAAQPAPASGGGHRPQGGQDAAEALAVFEDSIKGAERAWHGSSMLRLSRGDLVAQAVASLREGTGEQIGDLLSRMAHESYLAAAPSSPGFDAAAAGKLCAIVMGLLAADMAQELPAPREPEAAVEALLERARVWIGQGEGDHPDLRRIADFTGGGAAMRTALVAPLGPTLVALGTVVRAAAHDFNFREAPRRASAGARS